ncbi:hypothetical protein NHF39_21255 [Pseudomonas proteolytica]|nr:hypothetical protein [Pseudomonas proteolytica]USW93900.1 hypothetical protein NHF39_21255 [Pseudomonas proteolytica]USX02158.1 hypothetical protein NHF41_10240 [Pseudomonas proteolytica]
MQQSLCCLVVLSISFVLSNPMRLSQYLTEYDEDLSGDSQIDPLGVLIIWSAFGQQIFRNRVNSVSNDVRNYTLNLLHHAVIKDLLDDVDTSLSKALDEQSGGRHGLALRQACLVYLENIFTYAVVTAAQDSGVDSQGVLGASKARARLEVDSNPFLRFTHKTAGHLLVRQLGLGVSGRYKTPFMQIGFFNDRYNYHYSQEAAQLWLKVKAMIQTHAPFSVLFQEARMHLQGLFRGFKAGGGSALKQVPDSLIEAYRRALPNSAQVGADTRDFWLGLTGLDTGAAGALLQVLDDQAQHHPGSDMPIQQLFSVAEKTAAKCPSGESLCTCSRLNHCLRRPICCLRWPAMAGTRASTKSRRTGGGWDATPVPCQLPPRVSTRIQNCSTFLRTPAAGGWSGSCAWRVKSTSATSSAT